MGRTHIQLNLEALQSATANAVVLDMSQTCFESQVVSAGGGVCHAAAVTYFASSINHHENVLWVTMQSNTESNGIPQHIRAGSQCPKIALLCHQKPDSTLVNQAASQACCNSFLYVFAPASKPIICNFAMPNCAHARRAH